MRRAPWLFAIAASLGCVNEYHPEYHPESRVTYVQNVSYPRATVVEAVASASASPPSRPAPGPGLVVRAPPPEGTVAAAPAPSAWQNPFERPRPAPPREGEWERVAGREPPGRGEVDVVVEVPLRQAKAMAANPTLVEADCLPRGQGASYGRLTAVRRDRARDDLAHLLLKVREPGHVGRGDLVAVSVGVRGARFLTVGRVAGPADEAADDALVREGVCRRERGGEGLSCSGALRVD